MQLVSQGSRTVSSVEGMWNPQGLHKWSNRIQEEKIRISIYTITSSFKIFVLISIVSTILIP